MFSNVKMEGYMDLFHIRNTILKKVIILFKVLSFFFDKTLQRLYKMYLHLQDETCACGESVQEMETEMFMCNFTCFGRDNDMCGGEDFYSIYGSRIK